MSTSDSAPLRVLYLVHDLSDPAVDKRTIMLRDGGARVTVAGFRRTPEPIAEVAGTPAINLGQTQNGGFLQRIIAVLQIVLSIRKYRHLFLDSDVVIARNLEMLAIGVRGQSSVNPAPKLIYESLDIHRLLLDRGIVGRVLRGLEGWLSKRAAALITSSPAFVENYFKPLSQVQLPVVLIENKVYSGETALPGTSEIVRPAAPPWKIGWFGAIRCRKSLDLLSELVKRAEGLVEVTIRGRPAYNEFADFARSTTETPGLRFGGAYRNPVDLDQMYGNIHFTWAIDMFEEGQNSTWLLPNRLYEGGRHGSVPLAVADVETGHKLAELGIGRNFPVLTVDALLDFFRTLTAAEYQAMSFAARSIPAATWSFTRQDCVELVAALRSAGST